MLLPPEQFTHRQDQVEGEVGQVKSDVLHIKGKVDMLNDWHNSVNLQFEKIEGRFNRQDERLAWILRIAVTLGLLSSLQATGFHLSDLLPFLTTISKLLGV